MKRLALSAFLIGIVFAYAISAPGQFRAARAIGGGLLYAAIAIGTAWLAQRKGSPTPARWGIAVSLTFMVFAAIGQA